MKPKIIALYLPQFHQIPENDKFWGNGFTDWVTVKNAKPLFEGHRQPRVPLNKNYYDLSLKDNVVWQAKLAFDHGIYGFGVYHYWFNNEKNLLIKPAEIMRDAECIQTKYFFVWDNCSWKRSWSNVPGNDWAPVFDKKRKKQGPDILIPYILGRENDWLNHYNYLRSHFFSERYEKREGKPVFSIINYNENLKEMCDYWDNLAKNDGFEGMFFIFKYVETNKYHCNSCQYNYEPHHTDWTNRALLNRIRNRINRIIHFNKQKDIIVYDYDDTWRRLIRYAKKHKEESLFHGAFIDYDDTPRRGRNNARLIVGAAPEKFEKYFTELVSISLRQKKDYIILTAWNEWGEGAYLEPDTIYEYAYLKVIKNVITKYYYGCAQK